jgi:hypothetical protein
MAELPCQLPDTSEGTGPRMVARPRGGAGWRARRLQGDVKNQGLVYKARQTKQRELPTCHKKYAFGENKAVTAHGPYSKGL